MLADPKHAPALMREPERIRMKGYHRKVEARPLPTECEGRTPNARWLYEVHPDEVQPRLTWRAF